MNTKSISGLIFLLAILGICYFFTVHQFAKDPVTNPTTIGFTKNSANLAVRIAPDFLFTDYGKFYQSNHFAKQGQSLYATVYVKNLKPKNNTTDKVSRLSANLNPPFFQLLIYPLSFFGYFTSLKLWVAISVACGIIAAGLIPSILKINYSGLGFLLVLALFIYFPTFINICYGQVSLLLLPLLISAWGCARNNKSTSAAIFLGILASIKIFFGLFFLYFLIRKEWRALCLFIATGIICALLPLTIFSVNNYFDYQAVLHHIWWYSSSWNASLYGFLLRIFAISPEKNIALFNLPRLGHFLYLTLVFFLVIGLIKFLRPSKYFTPSTKCDLDFSIIIVAILLIGPLSWIYYFSFLIIPIVTLYKLANDGYYSIEIKLLLIISIMLSSIPFANLNPEEIKQASDILLRAGIYFYALIILAGLLFFLRYQINQLQIPSKKLPFSSYLNKLLYTMAFMPSIAVIISSFAK